jgi:hypothetical protein
MKRIAIAILAGGLSLSALALGSKEANAAEPCAAPVVQAAHVQPAAYYGFYGPRARDFRYRERLRLDRERELARRRWFYYHRY